MKVDYVQVWRFAHAEGLSFKKSVLPAEQLRPKIARQQEQWKKYQGLPDPARLVFVDETWAKTNMAPLRGWAPKGQRLHAKVPYGHWKTMTFIAALRIDRIDAPFVFDQHAQEGHKFGWCRTPICLDAWQAGQLPDHGLGDAGVGRSARDAEHTAVSTG